MIRGFFVFLMLCTASFMMMPACSGDSGETEMAATCSDCAGDGCTCKAGECDCDGCGS